VQVYFHHAHAPVLPLYRGCTEEVRDRFCYAEAAVSWPEMTILIYLRLLRGCSRGCSTVLWRFSHKLLCVVVLVMGDEALVLTLPLAAKYPSRHSCANLKHFSPLSIC
jgi:hypothetical protein